MEQLFYFPNLPDFPEEFILDIDAFESNKLLSTQIDRFCSKDGVKIPNTLYTRHPVSDKIRKWVDVNVGADYADIGISFHGAPGGEAVPHTDRTRNWTLIWLFDEGGDKVDTVYWQEHGCPLIRTSDRRPETYETLTEISRNTFKKDQWFLLDARAIHSIEGIKGFRKALQIGFWNDAETLKILKNGSFNLSKS